MPPMMGTALIIGLTALGAVVQVQGLAMRTPRRAG
jgi:hypothetical protein